MDCLLTAISSAAGQLFIFATISRFGPVVFTIIMTVRQVSLHNLIHVGTKIVFFQGLSILLSCLLYKHHITVIGILGIFTVFLAIFLRIYYGQQHKKRKHQNAPADVNKVWILKILSSGKEILFLTNYYSVLFAYKALIMKVHLHRF